MDRRHFIIATVTGIVTRRTLRGRSGLTAEIEGTSPHSAHQSLTGPAIGGTEITRSNTGLASEVVPTETSEQVVLTGQLTGNYSSDVGTIQVGPPGENISVNILSNGFFSADVPKNTPLDIAYVEYDSENPIVFNGNPDVHYIERIEALTDDRDLDSINIPEGNILDLKFEDQDGDPLNGIVTSVRSLDPDSDRWWQLYTPTNVDGFYQSADSPTGIEVSGDVEIAVLADSEDTRVPDTDVVVDEITVTDAQFSTYTVDPVTASGQIVRPNGAPIAGGNLSIFIERENAARGVTDDQGAFEIQIPRDNDFPTGAYQVQYYRAGLGIEDESVTEGGWVDMYAGPQLTGTMDQDVGTIELPDGNLVTARVVDESGEPVEGAAVRYDHRNESSGTVAGFARRTDRTGQISLSERTGLRLAGTVEIFASPPDDSRFIDTTVVRSLTADEQRTVQIELPTKDGEFQLEFVDVPADIIRAEAYTAAITVTNRGGGGGTQVIEYELQDVDGSGKIISADTTISLGVGESETVQFDISKVETESVEVGEYVHTVSSNDDQISTGTTVVAKPSDRESPLSGTAGEYDTDGTGTITASELGDAVTDFGQGKLSASELGDVVTAFGQS